MTGLVVLHKSRFIREGSVPIELSDHITQAEYSTIAVAVRQCEAESTTAALLGEAGVCIFFCLFCAFCCHPCIVTAIFDSTMPVRFRAINESMYQSHPVIAMTGVSGNISINIALIDQYRLRNNASSYNHHTSNPVAFATAIPASAVAIENSSQPSAPPMAEVVYR